MEISPSLKQRTASVSAFERIHYQYAHWNTATEKFETRTHCGYISEAPTEEEAVRELIRMVHPMHFKVGEKLMESIKQLTGVSRP